MYSHCIHVQVTNTVCLLLLFDDRVVLLQSTLILIMSLIKYCSLGFGLGIQKYIHFWSQSV